MGTVTGYTAERMQQMWDESIIAANISGDDLILFLRDGSNINVGDVRGPIGPTGVSGDTSISIVTSGTRPGSPAEGTFIYETDTDAIYSWNGTSWVYRGGVIICTSVTRPVGFLFNGLTIYETDTKRTYTYDGALWKPAPGQMRCKVKRTTVQNIPNAVITQIIWAVEEYDTDSIWAVGGPTYFTIPTNGAGLWRFTLNAQFSTVNSVGGRQLGIERIPVGGGGASENIGSFNAPGSPSWYVGGSVVAEAVVGAGDLIVAVAYQNSGTVLINIDPVYNVSFSAVRLSS